MPCLKMARIRRAFPYRGPESIIVAPDRGLKYLPAALVWLAAPFPAFRPTHSPGPRRLRQRPLVSKDSASLADPTQDPHELALAPGV